MQFYRVEREPISPTPGTCYLTKDNWDDFGYKTAFVLYYCGPLGQLVEIGSVKIMSDAENALPRTDFGPLPFNQLDPSYCSLGQTQGYYEELMGLDDHTRVEILRGLRDCVHDDEIFQRFRDKDAFQTSLLRSTHESDITSLYRSILSGNAIATEFNFTYALDEFIDARIQVEVRPGSTPPTNIHVLIGRNGVGKTRLLSGIADAITGADDPNGFGLSGQLRFVPNSNPWRSPATQPSGFANVVAIAFSAFDGFTPIAEDSIRGDIRYAYVGLKNPDRALEFKNQNDLESEFASALKVCLDGVRQERWLRAIRKLHTDPIFSEYDFPGRVAANGGLDPVVSQFSKLSSGHKIILLSVTRLVQLVDERTLVLIDEPENHLHPPLLAAFVRALSELVISRNGVALIATHSPVVLQEVPRSCVTIVDKIRSQYRFFRPEVETFGENVGTLTREVFDLEVTNSGYHSIIDTFLQNHSYDDLLTAFSGQIGAEGRTLARTIWSRRDHQ